MGFEVVGGVLAEGGVGKTGSVEDGFREQISYFPFPVSFSLFLCQSHRSHRHGEVRLWTLRPSRLPHRLTLRLVGNKLPTTSGLQRVGSLVNLAISFTFPHEVLWKALPTSRKGPDRSTTTNRVRGRAEPSILLPQHQRRHRPVPLGDHVERASLDVVSAQEPASVFEVAIIG